MNTTAAQWVWCDDHGGGRNVFAWFRRQLDLTSIPTTAVVHLFADNRWRLRIDGVVVAYGPGRFVPAFPEYDTIDLQPWLHRGTNLLLVEVWSPGSSNYQAMPESSGGFIAWGSVTTATGTHDLTTAGDWQVRRGDAWDGTAPAYSFAQGPIEVLDLRALPTGGWIPTATTTDGWQTPVARRAGPWGKLTPRSIPALSTGSKQPASFPLIAALADDEIRYSCRRQVPTGNKAELRFPYALTIHSPRAQRVRLGLFWGPHWLNGEELPMTNDPLLGNRQNTEVALQAGDNLLYGEPHALREVWAQYIAVPKAAGLECGPLLAGDLVEVTALATRRGAVPRQAAELARISDTWQAAAQPSSVGAVPARDLAWDRPARVIARDATGVLPLTLDAARDPAGWVLLIDFAAEFLGHTRIDIDAPAGTVLDVASDERLRADGLLGLYGSNPFVDGADRVVLAGGRQQVELFHARGGRYLQVAVRPPVTSGTVIVHAVSVRDHQVPVRREGAFTSSDAVFDWTWDASYRTLQACIEDAFLDCPWRERGTYLGDALVEAATLAAFTRDASVARRSLDLWAQGQLPDGQMQACVPSWHRSPLPDFSLIWILLLHQMWSRDGNLTSAARWWPVVPRILESAAYVAGAGGLWDAPPGMFIDWGVDAAERTGSANGCLNAFRLRALECAGELARALGRTAEAQRFADERSAVLGEFRQRLWLSSERRFARRMIDGAPDAEGEALHTNVLALAFGLAAPEQTSGLLDHVVAGLTTNPQRTLTGRAPGYLELYFLSYALEGLYRHGRTALAEQTMRDHWGAMRERGAWTIWECLRNGEHGAGSLCHAWSTTPTRWFHERILGVRPETPGDPRRMLVAPDSLLAHAEGIVPHPLGDITVAWQRLANGRLHIVATGPAGVELRIDQGIATAAARG